MKFVLALAALLAVAYAAPTQNDKGFRNEFDHLLVIEAEHRFKEIEQGLMRLSLQVETLEKSKSKALKAEILREITIGVNFATGAKEFFTREAKRTDLDLVEKFNYDAAVVSAEILIKDLTELAKKVNAIDANNK
uniref:Sui m 5.03 allergen n=1 Tax=Suidasia medanensis TaxID=223625 RepID=B2GM88_9ACAR|nr:Sui m 5.03 allergen [Suidasia medanensis]